jgi:hypothetical protein
MGVFREIEQSLAVLSPDERKRLAVEMAVIVSSYGSVAPTVIEPDDFASISSYLEHAHATGDSSELAAVQESCHRIFDRYPDDEPGGAGFFAFAVVVSLYYATETLLEDSTVGVINAAKRFLDVLGAADDDRGAGVLVAGQDYLLEPNDTKLSSLRHLVQCTQMGFEHSQLTDEL